MTSRKVVCYQKPLRKMTGVHNALWSNLGRKDPAAQTEVDVREVTSMKPMTQII